MKIQVIGYDSVQKFDTSLNIEYSRISCPNSLDEYDINIINLQNENIWRNTDAVHTSINYISDFKSLKTMISNSTKSKNIIALPQNYNLKYNYRPIGNGRNDYVEKILLKDMLYYLGEHILLALNPSKLTNKLFYENTNTICADSTYKAAFCFDCFGKTLTKSNKSEKSTTVEMDGVIFTALDLYSEESKIDDFLYALGLLNVREEYPEWIYELEFFDDNYQKQVVKETDEKIECLKEEKANANSKLEKNLRYKSILTANGENLVNTVFDVLEQVLDCDLSEFKDEKKEDFLIKKEKVTFIGEIKGVTSNVKNEHISQVDVHCQSYLDKLQEENISENVKSILVINPLRTKVLSSREEIHEKQIALAKRNNCLIVTTETLLFIFEKFLKNELDAGRIIETFKENVGILKKELL